jgi:hypothetical protein
MIYEPDLSDLDEAELLTLLQRLQACGPEETSWQDPTDGSLAQLFAGQPLTSLVLCDVAALWACSLFRMP